MGTTSVGHLLDPGDLEEGLNFPKGAQALGGAPVAGHLQSLLHPRPVKMAERLHLHRHATALAQRPVRDSLFPLSPSSVCHRCLLGPRCHLLHRNATQELSELSWKPAGGFSRNKLTSTRMVVAYSLQILPSSSLPLHPSSLCRAVGLNPVLRPPGAALQLLAPQ